MCITSNYIKTNNYNVYTKVPIRKIAIINGGYKDIIRQFTS